MLQYTTGKIGCREENNCNDQLNFVIIYIHAYLIENA
jgi:hypothetical protein